MSGHPTQFASKTGGGGSVVLLFGEYAEPKKNPRFDPDLACYVTKLTLNMYVFRSCVIYRVYQAEYASRIPVAAPQEYVKAYSPRGVLVK